MSMAHDPELVAELCRLTQSLEDAHVKIDRLLCLITPVHAHAEWVDYLRARLHSLGLVRNRRLGNG